MPNGSVFWSVKDAFFQKYGSSIVEFSGLEISKKNNVSPTAPEPIALLPRIPLLENAKYKVVALLGVLPDFVSLNTGNGTYFYLVSDKVKSILSNLTIPGLRFYDALLYVNSVELHYYAFTRNSLANSFINYRQSLFTTEENGETQIVSIDSKHDYESYNKRQWEEYYAKVSENFNKTLVTMTEEERNNFKIDLNSDFFIPNEFHRLVDAHVQVQKIFLESEFNLDWFKFTDFFQENEYVSDRLKIALENGQCTGLHYEPVDNIHRINF